MKCVKLPCETVAETGVCKVDDKGQEVVDPTSIKRTGWAYSARMYFLGVPGLEPMDVVITGVLNAVNNLCLGIFSYATGELT